MSKFLRHGQLHLLRKQRNEAVGKVDFVCKNRSGVGKFLKGVKNEEY